MNAHTRLILRRAVTVSLALACLASAPGPVASAPLSSSPTPSGDGAFLFAYRAKPGRAADFAQGYRRHLDWHAAKGDSLSWLAWHVIDGPSLGTFVDGTFGVSFRAFDERVDPRGDGEDAGRNVTAFADPIARGVYRLRRDLGTADRLERGHPGAMQRVVWLTLRPGAEAAFEAVARRLASSPERARLDYAVYERLSGGDQPAFVLIAQFARWGDLEHDGADPGRALVRAAGDAIARVESESWAYSPELSYIAK